jgi:medium-chain acyl-[acyl-carrier-protein] hydrolase
MNPSAPSHRRWIRCQRPGAAVRLFCLPYAGGGAAVYRAWGASLPAAIGVCAIQLPGREDRLAEAPFTELRPLVDALAAAILPSLDRPFALFGHSMGALIAYELARELHRQTGALPLRLFVSGRGAPHLPPSLPPIHHLPEKAFLSELQHRYGGIPAMLWQEAELRELLLPQLRADLTLVETYAHAPSPPLPCALTAFGGTADQHVGRTSLAAWRDHVRDDISVQMFAGGHFYLNDSPRPLLHAIATSLGESLRTDL